MSLSTNLVAYWPLSEATGSRATSVGDRNLTSNGSVGYAEGIIGAAASFGSSTSSQYLSHIDHADLDLASSSAASDWSVCAWAYCTSFLNLMQIISKADPSATGGMLVEYGIYVDVFGGVVAAADYGSAYRTASWDGDLSENEWFFVTAVLNTTGEDSGLTLYAAKATDTEISKNTTKYIPVAVANTSGVLSVGSHLGNQRFMDGRIDEVGLWKRALTDDEVSQLFNSGAGVTHPFGKAAGQDMDWVSPPAIVTRPSIRAVPAEYPLPSLGDVVTGAGAGGTPTIDSWRSETEVPVLPRPLYSNVYAEPIVNNRELVVPPVDAWWSNAEIPTPIKAGSLEAMAIPAVGPTAVSEVNVPAVVAPPDEYTPARTEEADEYRSRNV